MYRRVRRLYDAIGVSSRAELRATLTGSSSDRSDELVVASGG
jgi:hypothetical protein